MKIRSWTREETLVDMAPHYGFVSALWLPFGLQRMETRCAMRIQLAPSSEALEETRQVIRKCPHLHPVIKRNLLYNIRLRIKGGRIDAGRVPSRRQMEEMAEEPFRTYMQHPAYPEYATTI
jgi:hypothetical protein